VRLGREVAPLRLFPVHPRHTRVVSRAGDISWRAARSRRRRRRQRERGQRSGTACPPR
jgi:hypothetical protein